MRRIYVNLAVFVVLTAATIAWSAVNFLHLEFLERPDIVTAEFAQSPGLRAGYEVTYLGHAVGRIRGVELVPGMSEVQLSIDRDAQLPSDIVAAARRRSAIGEPYVDLAPRPGTDPDTGPRLSGGDRIEFERTSSPLQYGDLFRSLDVLVEKIDADSLAVVTDELATALDGRGDDIRRIVQSSKDLTTSLAENADDLDRLIDGVAEITHVLAENRDALGSSIDSLAGLTRALEDVRPGAEDLIEEGPSLLALLNGIIEASDDAIICTVDGAASLEAILDAEAVQSLSGLFQRSAAFADVIRLVQDPRDGIFRLYVSPSGGNPPTVEFAQPKPYPDVPDRLTCPAHEIQMDPAPTADESPPGSGGTRPGDVPTDEFTPRPGDVPADLASGTSDDDASDSLVDRVLGAAGDGPPLLAALVLAALLVFTIARRRRQP